MALVISIILLVLAIVIFKKSYNECMTDDENVYKVTYLYDYSSEPLQAYNKIQIFANENRDKIKILKLKIHSGYDMFDFNGNARIELVYKSLDGKTMIDDSLLKAD